MGCRKKLLGRTPRASDSLRHLLPVLRRTSLSRPKVSRGIGLQRRQGVLRLAEQRRMQVAQVELLRDMSRGQVVERHRLHAMLQEVLLVNSQFLLIILLTLHFEINIETRK